MPVTAEERQEIINAACEKALLTLPEVVGALMTQHAALLDINRKFYTEHAEFTAHKSLVQSVIEQLEQQRPTRDYKDLLRDAVPMIQERIKVISGLDMTTVKRPDRHMPHLTVDVEKGNPHGEL